MAEKNALKVIWGQTDGPTNIVSYRGACMRLKIKVRCDLPLARNFQRCITFKLKNCTTIGSCLCLLNVNKHKNRRIDLSFDIHIDDLLRFYKNVNRSRHLFRVGWGNSVCGVIPFQLNFELQFFYCFNYKIQ